MTPSCPACGRASAEPVLETHFDRHGQVEYSLRACPCGAVFAWPCAPADAAWYAKAVPLEADRPPERDPRYALFFRDLSPEPGLLDLGCGDGAFLSLASCRGFSPCMGLDHDERRAAAARARGLDVRTGDWAAFLSALPPGSLRTVTLFDVLEHLHDPRTLLAGIHRALGRGGRLVVTVPNGLRPLPFGREDFDKPPHHLTRWTPEALRTFLEREGFAVRRLDASRPDWALTRDLMAIHWAVKPALKAAKRLLFGPGASEAAGVTELYASGTAPSPLAGKGARRALFEAFAFCAKAAAALPAGALCLWWALARGDAGASLYVSAESKWRKS